MNTLILYALLLSNPSPSVDAAALPLKCHLLTTADNFWFYKEQMIYKSDQFAIFQNFVGRAVTQVDLNTSELIRTTYIGDPYDPKYQILMGRCTDTDHVLTMWELSKKP